MESVAYRHYRVCYMRFFRLHQFSGYIEALCTNGHKEERWRWSGYITKNEMQAACLRLHVQHTYFDNICGRNYP